MTKKSEIFRYLEVIAPFIPAPIYWLNVQNQLLGANDAALQMVGVETLEEVLGKSASDVYPKELADKIINHDNEVMSSGKTSSRVEVAKNLRTDDLVYVKSVKSPLYDENGKIIGIIGTSIDITAEKKLEQLQQQNLSKLESENKVQQRFLEQEKKFKKIARQVAHDLGSPLVSLQMLVNHCDSLPENNRRALNKSAMRIADIAENLLSQFRAKTDTGAYVTIRQPTLISSEILEVLTEKKYEYSNTSIDFISNFTQAGYFAFVNIDAKAFKRTLSNLINNSVEALGNKIGEVRIRLNVIGNSVQIIIQDNGCGMDEAVKETILNNVAITSGKYFGCGIGFDQIRETLSNNDGKISIESVKDIGTKIILNFPLVESQAWIAKEIQLHSNTIVVILDDDDSIHSAWETRFEKAAQHIQRMHFTQGDEAIKYINGLNLIQKERVLLLTDYELLRQNLQGLDVINRTGIKNSILVTGYHNNDEVRQLAKQTNTKILPKPLASEISITLSETSSSNLPGKINLVFVYEDREFVGLFKRLMVKDDKIVDTYITVKDFMNNVSQYPKDTNILFGNRFDQDNMNGFELAEKLHKLGFNSLYLYSGRDYSEDSSIPGYLKPILKTDLQAVTQLLYD